MERQSLLPSLVLASMMFSCGHAGPGSGPDGAGMVERVVKEVVIQQGTPVTTADLGITGMSCEMMCGGSIRKALARLPGVSATEIAFEEGSGRDHAIVTYDDSQVTDAQLAEAVQKLHDGQYKVVSITITKQVLASNGAQTQGAASVSVREGSGVYTPPTPALLPSVLTLLTWILRT